MKIVSACLVGFNCRYDGKSKPCTKVLELMKKGELIAVCPEQLGGLPTPRIVQEQVGDKVITKNGKDVTEQFRIGAKKALKIALEADCKQAILKSKSPSCGIGKVYDGTFSGNLIDGDGVFTKLLKENGIDVMTENDI